VNNIIIILQKQQSTGGINQQGKQLAGTKVARITAQQPQNTLYECNN